LEVNAQLDEKQWLPQISRFYSQPTSKIGADELAFLLNKLKLPNGSKLKLNDAKNAWQTALESDPAQIDDPSWQWRAFYPALQLADDDAALVTRAIARHSPHSAFAALLTHFASAVKQEATPTVLLDHIARCGQALIDEQRKVGVLTDKGVDALQKGDHAAFFKVHAKTGQGAAIAQIVNHLPFSHTLDFLFAQCMQALKELANKTLLNKSLQAWRTALNAATDESSRTACATLNQLMVEYNNSDNAWGELRMWVDHGNPTIDTIFTPLRSMVTNHDEKIILVVWKMMATVMPLVRKLQQQLPATLSGGLNAGAAGSNVASSVVASAASASAAAAAPTAAAAASAAAASP
jgi:hypothetical protein